MVNGSEIYYETLGKGPAILMMHGGLGLSHDYLRPYFDELSETNTVVYHDHFGNGRSAKPDDYAIMDFNRLVSDGAVLMKRLGHERYTLIGHSYGGFIAQEFAAKNADVLDGLVLVNTAPAFDYEPAVSGPEKHMAAFGKLFSQPMANDADWRETWNLVIRLYIHAWDGDVSADLDKRTVYEHRAWNMGSGFLAGYNTLAKLPDIQTRALVISGRHDGITPPGPGAERIASLLPNATLKIFEGSGHYPFIEERTAFFHALTSWMHK